MKSTAMCHVQITPQVILAPAIVVLLQCTLVRCNANGSTLDALEDHTNNDFEILLERCTH